MNTATPDAITTYRPPDWHEPSPRELGLVAAAAQSVWETVRELWQSYLGLEADVETPQIGVTYIGGGAPAMAWQYGDLEGQARCGPALLHAIGAAAVGFDQLAMTADEHIGPLELAIVRSSLGAVLEPILRSLVTGEKRRVEWQAAAPDRCSDSGFSVATRATAAGVVGDLTLLLPIGVVRLQPGPLGEAEAQRLRTRIAETGVEVEAYIPGTALDLAELHALEAGDVVLLRPGVLSTVDIRVAGQTLAHGPVGAKGGRLAVHVAEVATGGAHRDDS